MRFTGLSVVSGGRDGNEMRGRKMRDRHVVSALVGAVGLLRERRRMRPVPIGGWRVFRVGQEGELAEADQFATDRIVDHRHAGWIKDNHRASDARHVAAEDDADAATGRNRQPQWAQVGDVGVVPAAGRNRLGMCGVSRK